MDEPWRASPGSGGVEDDDDGVVVVEDDDGGVGGVDVDGGGVGGVEDDIDGGKDEDAASEEKEEK